MEADADLRVSKEEEAEAISWLEGFTKTGLSKESTGILKDLYLHYREELREENSSEGIGCFISENEIEQSFLRKLLVLTVEKEDELVFKSFQKAIDRIGLG